VVPEKCCVIVTVGETVNLGDEEIRDVSFHFMLKKTIKWSSMRSSHVTVEELRQQQS
jgi:hypothetical protein